MDNVYPVLAGLPVNYLEIGVFEGMSMVWMLQKILTDPASQAFGVDPWLRTTKMSAEGMDEVRRRAFHNVKPWADKCHLEQGNSVEILKLAGSSRLRKMNRWEHWLGPNSVDLCMIDGGHTALDVLADSRLVYPLMKSGGWILYDDVENRIDKGMNHVKQGVAMFREEMNDGLEFMWKDRFMEAFRVMKPTTDL
jgi:hypothetical protein